MVSTVNYIDPIFTDTQKKTITYASRENIPLEANIFTPISIASGLAVDERKPVVIVLHAGNGSYTDTQPESWARDEFAVRGYLGISAEFRLDDGEFFPELQRLAAINVLCLIRYLRFNKNSLGIKGRNIFVMGISAGGVTTFHSNLAQNNLSDPYFKDELNNLYLYHSDGRPIPNNIVATATLAGAPNNKFLEFLTKDDSPNFSYHGTLDEKVLYSQDVRAVETMISLGIPSTLNQPDPRIFEGVGHAVGHKPEIVADMIPRFASLIKI